MQNGIVDYSNGLLGLGIDVQIQQELDKIQVSLNKIAELQRKKIPKVDGPVGVPYPLRPLPTFSPWPSIAEAPSCGVCGIKFTGPMGYVCPRVDCPSGVSCS